MTTYTVKQISEMLGTNPETVRRWIRDGKLKAVQSSRKDGNIVNEEELNNFVKTEPKYGKRLQQAILTAAMLPLGLPGAIFAGVAMAQSDIKEKKLAAQQAAEKSEATGDTVVTSTSLKVYLSSEIERLNTLIQIKQEQIQQANAEIVQLQTQLIKVRSLLEQAAILERDV